ncbi:MULTISPECIES: acyl-CoA dehydrogenase family protein [Pseudomonas syringae group]|uniref:acyl-CoA dehydrogenase family protein n=1 Tax=Pseudomonas syringae group TaxID=136849 RepID=UPI0005761DDE|nr:MULTISPECIES: acyl-CoA dehydrogenase family protein [Pseudomonas syringae group]MBN3471249.1 acyl-CoA/acyl-ACP dehydrogenase [Pseudomonas savastanoi pv. phaseolicola]MBN3478131.1 acyl-CoA/acyl-ACP dehydrogenase [Pseudomonas savastanoi pv. phaseolicola]UZS66453.1 acyl-CoA/acyl-ACP dehydrogenase [Pseudomonas syringae]
MKISDEGLAFLAEAGMFIDERIRPNADIFDKERMLPRSLLQAMARQGYFGLNIPKEEGGSGRNALEYGEFTALLGRACSSVRTLLTVHCSLVAESIARWGTQWQRREWLPGLLSADTICAFAISEPAHGSDIKGIATHYRKRGSNYIISGTKKWISFGAIADRYLLFAKCEGKMSAFFVDRAATGVHVKSIDNLLSQRASHLAQITFDEVTVNESQLLGTEGGGELLLMSALDQGRFSVAWGGMGLAKEALVQMIGYAKSREQFGSRLADFQLIQGLIGDGTTAVHASRAMCERAASHRMSHSCDAVYETTIAKYFAASTAVKVAEQALQVHGANGLSGDFSIERLFRDAKALEIIEGSSQMQQLMISSYAMTVEK